MKRYLVLFLLCALLFASCKNEPLTLLIGTYTAEGSEGVYRCQFNPVTGEATLPEAAIKADNPSYLALSEDNTLLYAVSEGRQSALNAYRYDAATDSFSLLSSKPTLSPGPCDVALFGGYAYPASTNYFKDTKAHSESLCWPSIATSSIALMCMEYFPPPMGSRYMSPTWVVARFFRLSHH